MVLSALEEAAALKAEGRVRDHHDTSNSLDRLGARTQSYVLSLALRRCSNVVAT